MKNRIMVNRDDVAMVIALLDRSYVAPDATPVLARLRTAALGPDLARYGLVETGLGVSIGLKENGEYVRG